MQPQHRSLLDILKAPGIHERTIAEIFPEQVNFKGEKPVFENPLRVMAFTNRCGSNLLGDYLRQTKRIGGFYESLNHDIVKITSEKHSIDSFPGYITEVFNRFSVNGNFGLKASLDQLVMLSRWNILGMFPQVKIVHIRRSDVVSQAVSHWIAHQTKRWTSTQEKTDIEPVYNFDRIDKVVSDTNFSNSVIPVVARALGAELHEVLYEDLTENPQRTITSLGAAISVDLSGWLPEKPKLARQADAVNKEFSERYISELNSVIR